MTLTRIYIIISQHFIQTKRKMSKFQPVYQAETIIWRLSIRHLIIKGINCSTPKTNAIVLRINRCQKYVFPTLKILTNKRRSFEIQAAQNKYHMKILNIKKAIVFINRSRINLSKENSFIPIRDTGLIWAKQINFLIRTKVSFRSKLLSWHNLT